MASIYRAAFASLGLALVCSAAHAGLSISNKPTQNMSCEAGVCTATAKSANLNVGDLTNMLAAGDTAVKTGGRAITIQVTDNFAWSSTSRLTLGAERSIVFRQPVTVASAGAITLTYDSNRGDLFFFDKGKVYFEDLNSDLSINDVHYTLVSDIATLASDISIDPTGDFAFTSGYDASADGVYQNCPIQKFQGTLEGLGHHIERLHISVRDTESNGLFCTLSGAVVRDLALLDVSIVRGRWAGALAGYVDAAGASVVAVSVSGKIKGGTAGGLLGYVGDGAGVHILRSRSDATVIGRPENFAGGLAGFLSGSIEQSFADARVSGGRSGGLAAVLWLGTKISNSYARGTVDGDHSGGLASGNCAALADSYSTAEVNAKYGGGLIYENGYQGCYGTVQQGYWDVETSGETDGCYDGDCSGAIGLTDAELKAGLPDGFDPNIWGQSPNINNGYPYLLANPPE